MRLFRMDEGDDFVEYEAQRFMEEHSERVIESWLERNSAYIVEEGGLLVIGRQVGTNLGTTIDLLGIDRTGNVAVVELKRDKTPRDTLTQALEYASFAATLDGDQLEAVYAQYTGEDGASLAERHREFFALGDDEAVTFNKDQVIVVVGTEVVQSIRQSAGYLRQKGLRVVCLEFRYFQARSGERLVSTDAVVGGEPVVRSAIATEALPKTTEAAFLADCDELGRAVFAPLLNMAETDGLIVNWGSRGFSLNAAVDGERYWLLSCYPKPAAPGQSAQSIRTQFAHLARKVPGSEGFLKATRERFLDSGHYVPAGSQQELKYRFQSMPDETEIDTIRAIVREFATGVAERVRAL